MLLAPWADRTLEIAVADRQVALVLREHTVRTVLLPSRHSVRVDALATGWGRKRAPGDDESDPPAHDDDFTKLSSADQILFLPTAELPPVAWTSPLPFGPLSGMVCSRIIHPVRYYESFLRRSEDLSFGDLGSVLAALVAESVSRWDVSRGGLVSVAAHVAEEELRIAAGASLATCGLEVTALGLRDPQRAGRRDGVTVAS